eukprot:g54095.t1
MGVIVVPFIVELTNGPCRRPDGDVLGFTSSDSVPVWQCLNCSDATFGAGFDEPVSVEVDSGSGAGDLANRCDGPAWVVCDGVRLVVGRARARLGGLVRRMKCSIPVASGTKCVERRPVRRRLVGWGGVKGPVRSPDAVAVMRCPFYRRRCLLRETVESVQSAPSRQGARGRRFVVDVRWGLQRCVGLVGRSFDASKCRPNKRRPRQESNPTLTLF